MGWSRIVKCYSVASMSPRPHSNTPHAAASAPTVSLLRLSAGQRLIGAGVLAAALWALVLLTIGAT
jgi:hypothetical protein